MLLPLAVNKEKHKCGRNFAWILWTILIILFFVYSITLIYSTHKKRSNPATRVTDSNENWNLPNIKLTAGDTSGAQISDFHVVCVVNDFETVGGYLCNHYFNEQTGDLYLETGTNKTSPNSFAVVTLYFNLTSVSNISSIVNQNAFIISLCEQLIVRRDNQGMVQHSCDSVSAVQMLPYGTAENTPLYNIEISRQKNIKLDADPQIQFDMNIAPPILSTFTGEEDISVDYSFLLIMKRTSALLNEYQTLVIEEIDPLDWLNILGTIGGAFSYITLAFGLFFFAHNTEREPRCAKILEFICERCCVKQSKNDVTVDLQFDGIQESGGRYYSIDEQS